MIKMKNRNKLIFFNNFIFIDVQNSPVIVHATGWSAARAAHYSVALLEKVCTDL